MKRNAYPAVGVAQGDIAVPGVQSESRRPSLRPESARLMGEKSLQGWTVLLRLSDARERASIFDWVEELGGNPVFLPDAGALALFLSRNPDLKTMIVMDCAAGDYPHGLIGDGLALRALRPDVPTIVVSGELRGNDYSAERKAVCDASLRAPVTREAFELGISAAYLNNPDCQARGFRLGPQPDRRTAAGAGARLPRGQAPAGVAAAAGGAQVLGTSRNWVLPAALIAVFVLNFLVTVALLR